MTAHPGRPAPKVITMMRHLFATAATATALILSATSAAAAPPANDSFEAAQSISAPLPWSWAQDTTEATTEAADERVLLEGCALSISVNGSVWFRYTDVDGAGFAVDVGDSSFLASVAIVADDPETGPVVGCAEGRSAARGYAGQTYWIMAYSDRPSVNGGTLRLSVEPLRPAPVAALTVDHSSTAYADGSLLVSGTYSCANAEAQLMGDVRQGADSRPRTNNFYLSDLQCDGTIRRWEAVATSFAGQPVFAGRAEANVVLFACGDLECAVAETTEVVLVGRDVSR